MNNKLLEISMKELKENDGKNGNPLWILIDGLIYDVTFYDHPGGIDVFYQDPDNYRDLFKDFDYVDHSKKAKKLMQKFLLGKLIH